MTGHKITCLGWLLSLILGAGAQSAGAAELVVGLSVGPTWGSGGNTQTFFVQPQTERTYTADRTSNVLADGELFLGAQGSLLSLLYVQLGIAVGATSGAILSGSIWDDANSAFDNFTYQYQAARSRLSLKSKVSLDPLFLPVTPYVSGSIGVGFNRASGFTNRATIPQAIAEPNFADNYIGAFTYAVGVGVERAITDSLQIGLGYEFSDWGPIALAPSPGQTLGSGLVADHFFTHGLLFSISFHR